VIKRQWVKSIMGASLLTLAGVALAAPGRAALDAVGLPAVADTSPLDLDAAIAPGDGSLAIVEPVLLAQNPDLSEAEQEELDELLRQGLDRFEANDYAGAIAAYQQATRLDPNNARLYSGIAYLYTQRGQYAEAIPVYEQAIRLDPDNLPFRYALAYSYLQLEEYNRAIDTYRAILGIDSRNETAYLGPGQCVHAAGQL
jgi:Flp pilus assembly protein TadD